MKEGDKVTFTFAKKQIEGRVEKVFPKTIYIRADFPREKGKLLKRKISAVK